MNLRNRQWVNGNDIADFARFSRSVFVNSTGACHLGVRLVRALTILSEYIFQTYKPSVVLGVGRLFDIPSV